MGKAYEVKYQELELLQELEQSNPGGRIQIETTNLRIEPSIYETCKRYGITFHRKKRCTYVGEWNYINEKNS